MGGGDVWNNYRSIKKILNNILTIILKKDSRYHTKYLCNDMNVLPIKKLFYKALVV